MLSNKANASTPACCAKIYGMLISWSSRREWNYTGNDVSDTLVTRARGMTLCTVQAHAIEWSIQTATVWTQPSEKLGEVQLETSCPAAVNFFVGISWTENSVNRLFNFAITSQVHNKSGGMTFGNAPSLLLLSSHPTLTSQLRGCRRL